MGDKIEAKRTAERLGIPCVPGSAGSIRDEGEARKIAAEIGYPVMVKAAAGGGGRGMKVAWAPDDIAEAISAARIEARTAFGSDSVYLEKYLAKPRHIEVQVLGDTQGHAIHLGERDCSLQRRHQKVWEEGPSPALNPDQREGVGGIVAKAMAELGYVGAGTVEFLYEGGKFFFIEMNTRVQVEHPVTEFITGVDIVKEQIRIAAGERLSFKQGDVNFVGHSIECRINAEDPETFVPSPGLIKVFSTPGGPGVRVETFVHSECTVSPYYDSMIAKIIVHGRDRTEAIARMKRTLEMTVIEGIKTSIPLHLRILADADFVAGKLSTSFMERFLRRPNAGPGLAEAV